MGHHHHHQTGTTIKPPIHTTPKKNAQYEGQGCGGVNAPRVPRLWRNIYEYSRVWEKNVGKAPAGKALFRPEKPTFTGLDGKSAPEMRSRRPWSACLPLVLCPSKTPFLCVRSCGWWGEEVHGCRKYGDVWVGGRAGFRRRGCFGLWGFFSFWDGL